MAVSRRSPARRAVIKAEDRIEVAMSDLQEEGGDVATRTVLAWFEEEYLAPAQPEPSAVEEAALADPAVREAVAAAKGGSQDELRQRPRAVVK